MGNNFSKPVRHNVRKQGQKPSKHGTVQSSQKLSREQLIFRIETLREELDENPSYDVTRVDNIQLKINQYIQQLDKLM
jgi:hypothetical protein